MLSTQIDSWLELALSVSKKSLLVDSAYSVGAVVTDAKGIALLSTGYSREQHGKQHAEEAAILKANTELTGYAIFSTLEPCSERASSPTSCCELIIKAGIKSCFFILKEPTNFVICKGVEVLTQNGVSVFQVNKFESEVKLINAHILK